MVRVPLESPIHEVAKLVTKTAKTDVEKTRAICWWVAHNIQYDVDFLNTGRRHSNSPRQVLLCRTAVCQGYADLSAELLRVAGVECLTVSGVAKAADYWPGCLTLDPSSKYDLGHVWNKVKINGQWFLIDVTWCAGQVGKHEGRYSFSCKWDEQWFLADPEGFLATHLPLVHDFHMDNVSLALEVELESQLVSKPLTSLHDWLGLPYTTPAGITLHVKTASASSTQALVHTQDQELNFTFHTPVPFDCWVSLERRLNGDFQKIEGFILLSNNGSHLEIRARFPASGIYILKLCGKPWRLEDIPDSQNQIWLRREQTIIVQLHEQFRDIKPFPSGGNHLGTSLEFRDLGFRITHPKHDIIHTQEDTTTIEFEVPRYLDYIPFQVSLYGEEELKQQWRYLYLEYAETSRKIHVKCPSSGEYLVKLTLPMSNIGRITVAAFLVICHRTVESEVTLCTRLFPKGQSWAFGPQAAFFHLGLRLVEPVCSTVLCKNGSGIIVIRLDHEVEWDYRLVDCDGRQVDDGAVLFEADGDLLRFEVSLPDERLYRFAICAWELEQPCPGTACINYLLIYDSKHKSSGTAGQY